MKTLFYIILSLVILSSCKKENEKRNRNGTVIYEINFTTDKITLKTGNTDTDTLYSQFGDYITSLTPALFKANIWTIGYIDTVFSQSNNNAQMLQYIEQNSEKLPFEDPSRLVDFSDNNIVTFNPVRYGRVNTDGQFEDNQIDFSYFYFMPEYFYHEIVLPAEYENIQLNMFPPHLIENNILKARHNEILNKLFPNAHTNNGFYFYFGNTDSTYVLNPNGETIPTSANNPITNSTSVLIIRSDNYTNMIYQAPPEGETAVMSGILSFYTGNLIQVYAGADNIPYTHDDVFVYAPKFWERIYSRLDIN